MVRGTAYSMGGILLCNRLVSEDHEIMIEVGDLTFVAAPINDFFSLIVVQSPTITPLGDTGA